MDKRFYVITYKETSIDETGVMSVDSGVFNYGYDDENSAKTALNDIEQKKVNDITDDGEDEDIECRVTWTDDDCHLCVTSGSSTFEYDIHLVIVPDYANRELPF